MEYGGSLAGERKNAPLTDDLGGLGPPEGSGSGECGGQFGEPGQNAAESMHFEQAGGTGLEPGEAKIAAGS